MNFEHKLPSVEIVKDRHPFLVNYCKNKKVLHVGCVDAGLLEERFNNGQLLHKKLDEVCNELWGIDIDKEGIDFLKSKEYKNLYAIDISDENQLIPLENTRFDIIILSEVVEHLLNVGSMIFSLKKLMSDTTRLIISAPNAFSLNILFSLYENIEYIHPDHNYYFSHVTLKNIIEKCELTLVEEYVYTYFDAPQSSYIDGRLNKRLTGEQIINKSGIITKSVNYLKTKYWVYLDCRKRNVSFVKNIIKEIIIYFLFKKSVFWSDGIIMVCSYTKE